MNTDTNVEGKFAAGHRQGLAVFPLLPRSGVPDCDLLDYWFREPTSGEIRSWDAGDYNLGVLITPETGIAVIEIEDHARSAYDALDLPETPMLCTPCGWQTYFVHPGFPLQNLELCPGVTFKAAHSYVVGPGSVDATGGKFEWDILPDDIDYSLFTRKLLNLYRQRWDEQKRTLMCWPIHADLLLEIEVHDLCLAIASRELGLEDEELFQRIVNLVYHCSYYDAPWDETARWLMNAAAFAFLDQELFVPMLAQAQEYAAVTTFH